MSGNVTNGQHRSIGCHSVHGAVLLASAAKCCHSGGVVPRTRDDDVFGLFFASMLESLLDPATFLDWQFSEHSNFFFSSQKVRRSTHATFLLLFLPPRGLDRGQARSDRLVALVVVSCSHTHLHVYKESRKDKIKSSL